jgi:Flp pilus assembly protein TadG
MNRRAHPGARSGACSGARRSRDGRLAAVSAAARTDRGASAVELAILAPALLVLTMIVIQFALWFQARQAALAAAQEGARDARVFSVNAAADPGWPQQVTADTLHYYHGLGTNILRNVTATPFTTPAGMAGVTVSGKVNSLLNMFGGITVTVTVQGPQECFHPLNPVGQQGSCGSSA